jgi:predicted nucleotide-binding protein (sugar kinase/HSP70/actin superfamily)
MRVGFPRLGSFHVFLAPALRPLGLELVVAPPSSVRTLNLGTQYNPEMVCTPCKLLYGNYVEALEQGVDLLLMFGGPGTCRLGYSARAQADMLRQTGFDFRVFTADVSRLAEEAVRFLLTVARPSWIKLFEIARYLLALIVLVDDVERATLRIRPLEREPGSVDRLRTETLDQISALPDRRTLRQRRSEWLRAFDAIPCRESHPLRIALIGDRYTMMEPFYNLDLERELGKLGVHVERSFWLSDTARSSLRSRLHLRGRSARRIEAGHRYLARDIGGFARFTVGDAALYAEGEVDGLIHLAPFNCTPEVMAHNALLALRRDRSMPLLSLSYDEHTGRAGLLTRLEAYVDLLERRRQRLQR